MDLVRNLPKPRRASTRSHKLKPGAIELLLTMTVAGASTAEIQKAVQANWGVSIHPNMVSYYRRTRAMRLSKMFDEALAAVRKDYRFGSLSERIGALESVATREFQASDGGSSRTILAAINSITEALTKAELMRIRLREIAYEVDTSEAHELILRELERHSHIS